ncbi:leukocyte antigen CD37 isoform X2 [Dromaius novaehollandiae]|uniref:leukocyte antigen CD37 isoform X2 n=1 Tax=Dromaius novaehollandiae TaxID=8790 RepID=UPI00311E4A59
MSPRGCLSATKYFLFFFNLFFFVLGSLLLAFGLWILFDRQSFTAALGSALFGLRAWSYVFCGVGTGTMALGFLGCLGALKELKCLLGLYFGFLLLLFAAQITVGVIVYTQRVAGPPGEAHESWDALQQQLRCCGWAGPQDWAQRPAPQPNASAEAAVAVACSCLNASAPRGARPAPPALPHGLCPAAPQDVYPQGCAAGARAWLHENLITIVGVCLGVALMELCLMMLSMFLFRNMEPDYDKLLRYR